MLSWRTKRQLIASLIVITFLGGMGFFIVRSVLPESSCFDNKKNQNEVEVDCGGFCAPCELKTPKDIVVFWSRLVPVKKNVYDVASFIRNPNSALASSNVEYEFKLFDNTGLIAERRGTTFIFPEERIHIVEANIISIEPPTRVEFKILKSEWVLNKESIPNLVVERRDYKVVRSSGGIRQSVIDSIIFNDSPLDFRRVDVNFLLLDKDENIIGSNKTIVESFFSRTEREVRSVWPGELPGKMVSIVVEPRVNVLDPTMILRPR